MAEQSESPFFPVPVRWFELPMNTARQAFMRLNDLTEASHELPKGKRVENPAPLSFTRNPVPPARTGQVLNERA